MAGGSNPAQPNDVLKSEPLPIAIGILSSKPSHPLPVFVVREGGHCVCLDLVTVGGV